MEIYTKYANDGSFNDKEVKSIKKAVIEQTKQIFSNIVPNDQLYGEGNPIETFRDIHYTVDLDGPSDLTRCDGRKKNNMPKSEEKYNFTKEKTVISNYSEFFTRFKSEKEIQTDKETIKQIPKLIKELNDVNRVISNGLQDTQISTETFKEQRDIKGIRGGKKTVLFPFFNCPMIKESEKDVHIILLHERYLYYSVHLSIIDRHIINFCMECT